MLVNMFSFPIPKVGNLIFHYHSQSQNLEIIYFFPIPNPKNWEMAGPFPIPNPKCEKVIPAHAWQHIELEKNIHTSIITFLNLKPNTKGM